MVRKKLIRYDTNKETNLIIQPGKDAFDEVKKNRSRFFGNHHPLVLELACGKGEYTVGLAPHYPEKNFLGVDIKGNRLRYGAEKANTLGLKNVGFIRTIIHHIDQFFAPKSIEEIWIIHPDPRPKGADARRRLTHPRFLAMYEKLLISGGTLRLKTDDQDLFTYSLEMLQEQGWEVFAQTRDLYADESLLQEHYDIKTNYEVLFHKQGRTICYLKARKTIDSL